MRIYFQQALNRKIDIKEDGRIITVTVIEAIAVTTTNRALKGDPAPTTAKEAMEAYRLTPPRRRLIALRLRPQSLKSC
jgi:hypothetical protein